MSALCATLFRLYLYLHAQRHSDAHCPPFHRHEREVSSSPAALQHLSISIQTHAAVRTSRSASSTQSRNSSYDNRWSFLSPSCAPFFGLSAVSNAPCPDISLMNWAAGPSSVRGYASAALCLTISRCPSLSLSIPLPLATSRSHEQAYPRPLGSSRLDSVDAVAIDWRWACPG